MKPFQSHAFRKNYFQKLIFFEQLDTPSLSLHSTYFYTKQNNIMFVNFVKAKKKFFREKKNSAILDTRLLYRYICFVSYLVRLSSPVEALFFLAHSYRKMFQANKFRYL